MFGREDGWTCTEKKEVVDEALDKKLVFFWLLLELKSDYDNGLLEKHTRLRKHSMAPSNMFS